MLVRCDHCKREVPSEQIFWQRVDHPGWLHYCSRCPPSTWAHELIALRAPLPTPKEQYVSPCVRKVRFIVDIKTAQAPRSWWGRAVVIRVLDTHSGLDEYDWVRKGVMAQYGDQRSGRGTRHLDSRYDGPRSAYGKALAEAKGFATRLNNLHDLGSLRTGEGLTYLGFLYKRKREPHV